MYIMVTRVNNICKLLKLYSLDIPLTHTKMCKCVVMDLNYIYCGDYFIMYTNTELLCTCETNETKQRLTEFCQENTLVITSTLFQQHKRRLYKWISPDGQHRNQIDYILCSQRWRSSIQPAKTRPGADCGSDYELIAKFRLKLKEVGKTTRPFRYDVNQIPYHYTVEVTIRF